MATAAILNLSYFPFWSNGLFPVATGYISAKFHSSTSIVILNYNFVMLDRARSPFVHLKFPFKFRVDRVRTFRDIAIRKFRKFGSKCLFRPSKIMFLGRSDLQTLLFIIVTPKRPYLMQKHAFWAINGVVDLGYGIKSLSTVSLKKRNSMCCLTMTVRGLLF